MTTKTHMIFFYLFIILLIIVLLPSVGYSQKSVGSINSTVHTEFNLLPVPQKVSLTDQHYLLDDSWSIEVATNISGDDPAVLSLTSELKERYGLRLKRPGRNSARSIQLIVKPGSVIIGQTTDTTRTSLEKQAYQLKLEPDRISITANGAPGLFYGVQTLIQLLQQDNDKTFFAGGEIEDWPDMHLRMIYWDDAHHLERLDAMKRAIRQAGYYKINAFALKLDGHFQFESAKPIVEPYAYTPAELQELTDYAKAHYVELVPYLDAPAHISFILKHPEYYSLRSFPNSNYELSVTNPKADELILGMFDDLMEANKGGKYLFLSLDEAYYVGKAESEKKRAEELGSRGKLLAEYITRIGNKLHEKGRTVIVWGSNQIAASDVTALPSHLVNGINSNSKEFAVNGLKFNEDGIRHLIFTSTQGEEPLFPNYYKLPAKKPLAANDSLALTDDEQQMGDITKGSRVIGLIKTISSSIEADKSNFIFMGVIVCGWGDAGLNPETFWLGYAAGTAAVWNVGSVDAQDLTNRFFNSFYGNKTLHMDRVYQLLSTQAEFWDRSWEWEPSNNRTPIFGYSEAVYDKPRPASDQTLPSLPVLSGTDLSMNKDWKSENKERLQTAEKFLKDNNELMNLLHENLINADYQHYNLQVLRSVAQLCRQNLNMLLGLQRINDLLSLSSTVASANPSVAISLIDQALDQVNKIREERNEVLQAVTMVWYQDWYPRVAEANGRKYLDQVDDVKDHEPVRTVDMSYLIYRELHYPLGKWAEETINVRNQFAKEHQLPLRTDVLDWENTGL